MLDNGNVILITQNAKRRKEKLFQMDVILITVKNVIKISQKIPF